MVKRPENRGARTLLEPLLGEEILRAEPRIVAGIIDNGNPVSQLPDSGAVARGLASVDFLVVLDAFLTDTAQLADVEHARHVAPLEAQRRPRFAQKPAPRPQAARQLWIENLDCHGSTEVRIKGLEYDDVGLDVQSLGGRDHLGMEKVLRPHIVRFPQ